MVQLSKYVLKRQVMTDARLQKIAKKIIDESFKDREKALEAYDFFLAELKSSSAGTPPSFDAVKGLTDSLRLAQFSFQNVLKLVEVMVKLNLIMKSDNSSGDMLEKGKGKSMFALLENLTSGVSDKDT